jgi:hypothetical protein
MGESKDPGRTLASFDRTSRSLEKRFHESNRADRRAFEAQGRQRAREAAKIREAQDRDRAGLLMDGQLCESIPFHASMKWWLIRRITWKRSATIRAFSKCRTMLRKVSERSIRTTRVRDLPAIFSR